jgi:hypothetical protein
MRTTVLSLLLLLPIFTAEGIDKGGRGVRPMALANAFAAATDDPWMPWHNPAGIGSVSSFRSSLCLVPEQFGMKELRTISAAVVIPTPIVNVGVVLDDFGSSLYRESTAVVGVARTIESGLALGLAANLGIVSIRRYGSASTLTLDFGVRLELDERVSLGYCWKNFGGAAIAHSGEGLPQSQTLGVRYTPHRLAQITVDLEKEVRYPFLVRAGVELHVLPQLDFRFGFSDNPEMLALGLGARMSGWECSYAVNTHPRLGLTHALGISFEILR